MLGSISSPPQKEGALDTTSTQYREKKNQPYYNWPVSFKLAMQMGFFSGNITETKFYWKQNTVKINSLITPTISFSISTQIDLR